MTKKTKEKTTTSFEATYRRYPFAPLVDLGLALARLFVRPRAPMTGCDERRRTTHGHGTATARA
ncbi:MAG: hypothetical protein D6826_08675 [Alphaproteobacteria bacterium]|nr:MAG: hypothetical protein D6826_08675 [Alphaproteobacteria bacterium]